MANEGAKGRLRALNWAPSPEPTRSDRPTWTATTELEPGDSIVVQLRDAGDEFLERSSPLFETTVAAVPGLVNRLTAWLVDAWHEDDPEEEIVPDRVQLSRDALFRRERWGRFDKEEEEWEEPEEEDLEQDEKATEPNEPPPPKPERIQPGVRPVRIALEEGNKATLFFQVNLPGHEFVAALPYPPRSETAPLKLTIEHGGQWFELVDLEASHGYSRPAYASYFDPQGYVWRGAGCVLCARPSVKEREGRVGFREALAVIPAIFAHIGRKEPSLEDIAYFLLGWRIEGPWWYYHLDEEPGDAESPEDKDEFDEDAHEERVETARRRQLLEILQYSGGPQVILFADGSSLASCSHRTGYKSDVLAIEVPINPKGTFTGCEVHLIYRGDY
jgi:hypothetical protein